MQYPQPSYLLNRSAKIEAVRSAIDVKSVIMIQARPGQGKTLFAKSLGNACFDKSLYYQVTEADWNAVHFCISLHRLCGANFPKYSCPEFDRVVNEGKTEAKDSENYVKMIVKSLRKNLLKRTVIILDDLNLLPDIGLACMTVLTAVSSSGGLLSFILCTQSNCSFPDKFSKLKKTVYKIDNEFLALTEGEFRELAVNIMDESCSMVGIEKVYQMTEGWAAGVVRILENLSPCRMEDVGREYFILLFNEYFQEVTAKYQKKNMGGVFLLSYLDTVEFALIERLDGTGKTVSLIQDILSRNLFASVSGTGIVFNRLFREWMRYCASNIYSQKEISEVFISAHTFEMQRGNTAKALEYLIMSEEYILVEEFVEKHYYTITSREYGKNLQTRLSEIPQGILGKSPWTSVLLGTLLSVGAGGNTVGMFQRAFDMFETEAKRDGMLAACCGLVCVYCTTEGDIKRASTYFDLLKRLKEELPLHETASIQVFLASALGNLYLSDSQKALESLDRALSLADRSGLEGVRIRIFAAYVMTYLSLSDREMADKYCDAMIVKLNTSGFSYPQKLFILEHLIYYSSLNGMSGMMRVLMDMVRRRNSLISGMDSRIGVFMAISEADYGLASDNPDDTLRILNSYSESRIDAMPAHRASFVYSMKAVAAAYGCDESAAVYAEKSVEIRESLRCNRYYNSVTYYLAGATYVLLSNHKKAEFYLKKAVSGLESNVNLNACAGAYAYLSYLYNNIGDRLRAREYAVYSLKMFRRTNYARFLGLLPEVILSACSYAFTDSSVSSFASQIAFEHYDTAFTDLGRKIPVMRVNTLNGLNINIGGKEMDCVDIGANFRLLMAALLSSGGYGIEQETLQTYIWPESGREQARKSFDNLVSRFRKMLSEYYPGLDPKDYLVLNSGILRLKNIKCDADEFLTLVKGARDSYASGGYTSSVEKLIKAEKLFHNRYFTNVSSIVSVSQKRREVDASLLSMLKTMHRLSFFLPEVFHPERFFDKWLDAFMSETEMVSMAFNYYGSIGKSQKCREIIRDFTAFLKHDGYTDEEIAELVFVVKTAI